MSILYLFSFQSSPTINTKSTPSPFTLPTPPAYPNWSIEHTKPLPYRPFRYGPKHHITMGMRKLSFTDWFELDNHYPSYHALKASRIASRGEKCCRTAPKALPAAYEFLAELCEYLPARYPTLFRRTETGIENIWSEETFDICTRPLGEDPMQMAARLVQDDLAIMIEKPDGEYYLLAGAVLLAGFWKLEDKFGMSLSSIHTHGNVPQFKEKLEKGMGNMFRRLKCEEIYGRNNYYVQVDDGLAWAKSIAPEDAKETYWATAGKSTSVEGYHFRSERQTVRRLPRSGAVVFTFRTYFVPLQEIVEEDYVPGRLASAVRSWGEDVAKYKGKEVYEDVLLEFLDRKHREQLDRGLDMSREDEVHSYPF
ncbi:hypothetical protein BO78DRAFT_457705 [Aspergillus sclerotiicarbonarius CBS 121057]|uniref:Mannosyl transferase n=1 Tax=Aspergillus sclerotiicarbonarius (strain CBS 121057 / IBT 28362) TaxID=1448318 RepID=A0A319ENE8_ASPSB|nr:hypothetical protein BO78DRAFT_457705 [Aspergillus sclerotiicarbonarius CBS 121057]